MNQVEILAQAITEVWGSEDVGPMERSEAADIIEWLNGEGYYILAQQPLDEDVSSGPIQRALGME
jgi:hypothetical protein